MTCVLTFQNKSYASQSVSTKSVVFMALTVAKRCGH